MLLVITRSVTRSFCDSCFTTFCSLLFFSVFMFFLCIYVYLLRTPCGFFLSFFFLSFLWPPFVADADIIFLPCGFFNLLFFLASQRSVIGCLPYFHKWCGLSANLECRSEACCTRLAETTGRKNSPSAHHRTTLSGYVFAIKADIDNRKKLVKHQYLLHMSSQYGELRPTNG